jgi:hypothetical protein
LQAADIDFFTDSFPSFDDITMGMTLRNWGLQKEQLAVQKVRQDAETACRHVCYQHSAL